MMSDMELSFRRSRLMTGTRSSRLAIGLAVTAACTFAVANVVQQRVAARLHVRQPPSMRPCCCA